MMLKENEEILAYIQNREVRIVAYLLEKLRPMFIKLYKQYCPFVEIKEFDYGEYPRHVNRLTEYRWKPLLVAEYLAQHDVVFWFDTSIIFKQGNETLKVRIQ